MNDYKKGGYQKKYIVQKINGDPIDPNAHYFVLRVDKDPHAHQAILAYKESVKHDNPEYAIEIEQNLADEYGWDKETMEHEITIEDIVSNPKLLAYIAGAIGIGSLITLFFMYVITT